MKRFTTIVLSMILLSVIVSNAQLMQPFKAKEGLSTALNAAVTTAPNAKLMAVATMSGDFDFQGIPITLSFDQSKGTSQAWVYMFRGTNPDTNVTVGVAKTAFGMQPLQIDPQMFGVQLPFQPESPLDGIPWMNSDSMMLAVNANSDFQTYKANNSDQKLAMTGLAVEPIENYAVWGVIFDSKNGRMNCMVDAVTGESICMDFTSVDESDVSNVSIYPNPAADFAILRLKVTEGINNVNLSIFGINGTLIRSIDNPDLDATGSIALNLSSLNTGIYVIASTIDGKTSTKTFVISR